MDPLLTVLSQRAGEIEKFSNKMLVECDPELVLSRNEEPRSLQATLAALSDSKLALLKPTTLRQVELLMKLLNRDDEPLLLDLLKE